ncbi:hypothetical protein LTR94_025685 [Friedmanniomyces endolithicus]|nr:hypothetical protein LTR94_025685 [Friedmanniomyces endolithicus]
MAGLKEGSVMATPPTEMEAGEPPRRVTRQPPRRSLLTLALRPSMLIEGGSAGARPEISTASPSKSTASSGPTPSRRRVGSPAAIKTTGPPAPKTTRVSGEAVASSPTWTSGLMRTSPLGEGIRTSKRPASSALTAVAEPSAPRKTTRAFEPADPRTTKASPSRLAVSIRGGSTQAEAAGAVSSEPAPPPALEQADKAMDATPAAASATIIRRFILRLEPIWLAILRTAPNSPSANDLAMVRSRFRPV